MKITTTSQPLIIDEAERLNLAELLLKKGSATQNFLQELHNFMHNPISGALRGFKSHPRVLRNQSIYNRGRELQELSGLSQLNDVLGASNAGDL